MIVLHLESCPMPLRGDLTKWLWEVATGIYVGKVSTRVRDKLWERVKETRKGGRAVMVFGTNNEQGFDFRVCGEVWEPIDFDGLKLMMKPSVGRLAKKKKSTLTKTGFSNAAKYRNAKRFR
ncbi:MAG: type I-E CRISPR-associated endoribonuclease Cas2e [Oscillospiraceae bacterium]|nr:type I-E CRISPR-associated endoribonuclease Cas2e [Oscillospiraceae bacterium]